MNKTSQWIVGNLRVQILSETLVRLEQRGPKGFEARETFTVVGRDWPGAEAVSRKAGRARVIETATCRVIVPGAGKSLKGVRVEDRAGRLLFESDGSIPRLVDFPGPAAGSAGWVMADAPRLVPPPWGATPAPKNAEHPETSGWDCDNNAPDLYVFVPGPAGYERMRADFLKLTGPIPMPPLWTFGLWDSRYHPYTEESALETIRTYRRKGIPLDVFVVDTDWRVGASHGYEVNRKLFPDMARFIRRAHEEGVRLVYNDHPEPVAATALDPAEMAYRNRGLASLLKLGVDAWWFDRNWHICLREPLPGLRKEVWGMRLYHDITRRFAPRRRPLIMSNVDGIDNGRVSGPSHPASHRFPIWWTGDTNAAWEDLSRGAANGVDSGIQRLMPYVNEDLGGHFGTPMPDLYTRYLQYGALCPVMRLHCSASFSRYPWEYGREAESIAKEYIRLRYRLLPTIYAAARRAYDDGTPLMRRCDLEWSAHPEAADPTQFLLGDDILVAPVLKDGEFRATVPSKLLKDTGGRRGLTAEYFLGTELKGAPVCVRREPVVDFELARSFRPEGIPAESFSVRWTGTVGPVPRSGTYEFGAEADDGVRLWLDGKLVVNAWRNQPTTACLTKVRLRKGQTLRIRIEYFQGRGNAVCRLIWRRLVSGVGTGRSLWLPPGRWEDLWTGRRLAGPRTIKVAAPLRQAPLFAREGGIIFSVPDSPTASLPWTDVGIDAYAGPGEGSTVRSLYEDDGVSNGYEENACARTQVRLELGPGRAALAVEPRTGSFKGAILRRAWRIRLHFPRGSEISEASLNGRKLRVSTLRSAQARWLPVSRSSAPAFPFEWTGAASPEAGRVLELRVPAGDLSLPVRVDVLLSARKPQQPRANKPKRG